MEISYFFFGNSEVFSRWNKSNEKIDNQGEKKEERNGNFQELEPKPLCVIFNELLANGSLKPSLLRGHFETRHSDYKDQLVEYFKRKLERTKSQDLHKLVQ